MNCGSRNPRGLKVRCYSAHLIEISEYLAVFRGENIGDKSCATELNEILLNSTTKIWGMLYILIRITFSSMQYSIEKISNKIL